MARPEPEVVEAPLFWLAFRLERLERHLHKDEQSLFEYEQAEICLEEAQRQFRALKQPSLWRRLFSAIRKEITA